MFPGGGATFLRAYFRRHRALAPRTRLLCREETDIGVFAPRHGRASAVAMGVVALSQRTVTHRAAHAIHARARTHACIRPRARHVPCLIQGVRTSPAAIAVSVGVENTVKVEKFDRSP